MAMATAAACSVCTAGLAPSRSNKAVADSTGRWWGGYEVLRSLYLNC